MTDAQLRALADAATQGPWTKEYSGQDWWIASCGTGEDGMTVWSPNPPTRDLGGEREDDSGEADRRNADFIAACDPDTIRSLLDRLAAQEARITAQEARITALRDLWRRGFREASWGHGGACNIHTRIDPGTGAAALATLRAEVLRDGWTLDVIEDASGFVVLTSGRFTIGWIVDALRKDLPLIEEEARQQGRAERDAELLKHGQINVGTVVGYEAGVEEGRREAIAAVRQIVHYAKVALDSDLVVAAVVLSEIDKYDQRDREAGRE